MLMKINLFNITDLVLVVIVLNLGELTYFIQFDLFFNIPPHTHYTRLLFSLFFKIKTI